MREAGLDKSDTQRSIPHPPAGIPTDGRMARDGLRRLVAIANVSR